jgi:hypothetical protein
LISISTRGFINDDAATGLAVRGGELFHFVFITYGSGKTVKKGGEVFLSKTDSQLSAGH